MPLMEISYSDGKEKENGITARLKNATDLSSTASIARDAYGDWATRYHLCPERGNLLRHFNFSGLQVLELGAGMGAVSRGIAERAASLTIVEGTQSRFDALSERLRDLKNWKGIVANIQDASIQDTFDVVCVIGVLEYSELYVETRGEKTPFHAFLETAKRWLRPEGVLILAIENRLGLKYWNGAAEDHTGRLYDGIAGYSLKPTPRTFSRRELKEIIGDKGFATIREYFPYPDYKIPSTVLSLELMQRYPSVAANLSAEKKYESYGDKRLPQFPDLLGAHSMSSAGLLPEFSNSFLWLASQSESVVLEKLTVRSARGELAWHYAMNRQIPVETAFKDFEGEGLKVKKAPRGTNDWEAVLLDKTVRYLLESAAYFEGEEDALKELRRFLRYSLKIWASEGGKLKASARDAIYRNAVKVGNEYRYFDLEWADEAISPTYFVFRNCLALGDETAFMASLQSVNTLRDLYETLCEDMGLSPQFAEDCGEEAAFQSRATLESNQDVLRDAIEGAMSRFLRRPYLPRGLSRENHFAKVRAIVLLAAGTAKSFLKGFRSLKGAHEPA